MGDQAAFISAGGYHHHIGLNTWESRGGTPPPPGHTGLYHTAIRYPDRKTLADALRRVVEPGSRSTARPITASARRSTCSDPDGNGVELYRDRPREEWPRERRRQRSGCSRGRSTSARCSPKPNSSRRAARLLRFRR